MPTSATHIPSAHDNDISCHNHAPMIHGLLLFPMHSLLHVSHLYVFLSSFWLTRLTDPALMASVYPNWMQYMPRILQEASLLDGVDAGVRGNGRRFSKTSSYPPCHHHAFNFFYPYFLTTSLFPLSSLIHSFSQPTSSLFYLINCSHIPYHPCSLLFPLMSLGLAFGQLPLV